MFSLFFSFSSKGIEIPEIIRISTEKRRVHNLIAFKNGDIQLDGAPELQAVVSGPECGDAAEPYAESLFEKFSVVTVRSFETMSLLSAQSSSPPNSWSYSSDNTGTVHGGYSTDATATVHGAAPQLVFGRVRPIGVEDEATDELTPKLFCSPITGKKCVYYRAVIAVPKKRPLNPGPTDPPAPPDPPNTSSIPSGPPEVESNSNRKKRSKKIDPESERWEWQLLIVEEQGTDFCIADGSATVFVPYEQLDVSCATPATVRSPPSTLLTYVSPGLEVRVHIIAHCKTVCT